jgi:Flp pilus assembly pilin Flp
VGNARAAFFGRRDPNAVAKRASHCQLFGEIFQSVASVFAGLTRRFATKKSHIEQRTSVAPDRVGSWRLGALIAYWAFRLRRYYSKLCHIPLAEWLDRKAVPMNHMFLALWSEDGQDIAEYAVMVAVILIIVVGTLRLIGSKFQHSFLQRRQRYRLSRPTGPQTCAAAFVFGYSRKPLTLPSGDTKARLNSRGFGRSTIQRPRN